ncbi:glycosyltransferase [Fictibacillus macauensis ZFHKF-1]|uniref:Glycosyltransferase n=1 Tax=Fictibacillus macauensis ZFHKF-1 TaxID=1196324 RepID=I8IYR9_9BACL|nr:hypothetical protein [Fictibacillus macauensis]EIT84621.1 glycosyltransferase [Fictibacillus macauensis ZFHKF-1]
MTTAACTIVSKNYWAYARTLAASIKRQHPDMEVFVLLADEIQEEEALEQEEFTLISLADLSVTGMDTLCFKYNITELNTALKPFLLDYLLEKKEIDKLIYFDPDILVLQSLQPLETWLDDHCILLTPHIVEPMEMDGFHPNETTFLQSGSYNLGFIAMKKHPEVQKFLAWWQKRLRSYCYVEPYRGLFVDQKWLDLAPVFFKGVYSIPSKAYNVAYWNLHEREIVEKNNALYIGEDPLVFYHFSGFDYDLRTISNKQNRYSALPTSLHSLFTRYKENLTSFGYHDTRRRPFTFLHDQKGRKISLTHRQLFRLLLDAGNDYEDPFGRCGEGFLDKLNATVGPSNIPWLFYELLKHESEVETRFSNVLTESGDEFLGWAKFTLQAEYHLSFDFISWCMRETQRTSEYAHPFGIYKQLKEEINPWSKE